MMKIRFFITALSVLVLCWPKTATAQCSTFGGRATVVQANGLGIIPVVLGDTGNIDSAGDAKAASLLTAAVSGLLSGEVAHAAAIGKGSYSRSESSLAYLSVTLAGNTIGAGFVEARANAYCGVGATGNTEIDGLVVNGQPIAVTGVPNQIIPLAGGASMVLNEQSGSVQNGSITVSAIHVTVPGVTDLVIGSAYAAINGRLVGTGGRSRLIVALLLQATGGNCISDFTTGGGWIFPLSPSGPPLPDKATFAAAGGVNPSGKALGHLEYVDHNTGMNVHDVDIPSCVIPPSMSDCQAASNTGTTAREMGGTARVRFPNGNEFIALYDVCVVDNGEPGKGNDAFSITLFDTSLEGNVIYTSGLPQPLGGGNIQLHK